MSDPAPAPDTPALALIREGWNHLKRQRPLAARASWLRALRIVPDDFAARDAIDRLARAGDLPREARVEPKLRAPTTDARRKRWDKAFRVKDLADLSLAADTFALLVEADLKDSDALFNQALGLAWLGRNVEAVEVLERSVAVDAVTDPVKAVGAWTLAELLRQGGGAEEIADDLTYTLRLSDPIVADPDFLAWLERRPNLQAATPDGLPGDARVFAWLDRVPSSSGYASPREVPRVLAYLVRAGTLLKLSGPDAAGLELVKEEIERRVGRTFERDASPLSLALSDAAVWAVRIPSELDVEEQARLRRAVVERFYEDIWITRPRKGLDGRSPLEAAALALNDPVARAKLKAVVAYREQLAERPSALDLYQGYPFDRLRRRLGLSLRDSENPGFDLADAACMSPAELDALNLSTLNNSQLADACESALPLRDDARSYRFAEKLAERGPKAFAFVDLPAIVAVLVRRSLAEEGTSRALAWLDLAEQAATRESDRKTFGTWRAEVFVGAGNATEAGLAYQKLLTAYPDDTELPLEAAESLIDQGFGEAALPFAKVALERAERVGDAVTARLAHDLLTHDPDYDESSDD